jgi:hypothetical protein
MDKSLLDIFSSQNDGELTQKEPADGGEIISAAKQIEKQPEQNRLTLGGGPNQGLTRYSLKHDLV